MLVQTLAARIAASLPLRIARHARVVVLIGLALAALSGLAAWQRLGVSTDAGALFSDRLPWRQRALALDRLLPQFRDLLVVVVDGQAPEIASATAAQLAAALAGNPTIATVRRPDALDFFATEGLLFLDPKELGSLLDQTIDAQPFLGQLSADPSARGLFAALSLVAVGVQQGQVDLTPYLPALRAFHDAISGALAGQARPLSWQRLLGGGLAEKAGRYRFVLVQPKLNYGALEAGGAATAAIRAAAAKLEFVAAGEARVRITGSVALADEEFATVAQGAALGTLGSLALVLLWLILALRSWRLIIPVVLTLVLGLVLTTGFAALAVGTLNVISVAFAILFVGIAVDFAIQFCVRYREQRFETPDPLAALGATMRRVGGQILVAAAATSAGFLAFVPTDFSGVAELGLIAGVGMLIAFACTLTFLPALLTLSAPRAEAAETALPGGRAADRAIGRSAMSLLGVFAAAAVLGVALLPRLTFDSDPLHTKDPTTEAMRTLYDLMDDPLTNPYSADILVPDASAAAALLPRLRALPLVADALSVTSFVPADQEAKLALIADAASVLAATLAPRDQPTPATPDDIRLAAQATATQIGHVADKLPPDHPLLAIARDLHALETAPDGTVMAVNAALTRFLPGEIEQLRQALTAAPVTLSGLPPALTRDWVLPDGRVRVQALARPAARDSAGLRTFAAQVQGVAPEAEGSAVTIVATTDTIIGAFRSAALSALLAIAVILGVALRRVADVALVLAPLLLSALMTVLVAALLPLPLNFANVIALPLLLGVGVSFNIYFVMNWRAGRSAVLGSATARAVTFSALTTGTAFSSLALSRHPGTASLGTLLLLSLVCTLVASLAFVPSLLAAIGPPRGGGSV